MTNLVFGNIQIAYDDGGKPARRKVPKKPRKGKKAKAPPTSKGSEAPTTTDKVAAILEEKYGVYAAFFEQNQDHIQAAMVHSAAGALEDLFAGSPITDPFAEAGAEIAAGFKQWLMQGEIEKMGIPGVPTKAAIERRSLRFKSKKGPSVRPSLVDTGLFSASATVWTEE